MSLLVWLHLLAAVAWIGGMVFVSVVLVPALKTEALAAHRGLLFRTMGRRFRLVVWAAMLVLGITGTVLLGQKVASLTEPGTWPIAARIKLVLVGLLVAVTAIHDFWLGPAVGRLQPRPPEHRTPAQARLLAASPWIPRLSLLLALAVLYVAVVLARA